MESIDWFLKFNENCKKNSKIKNKNTNNNKNKNNNSKMNKVNKHKKLTEIKLEIKENFDKVESRDDLDLGNNTMTW